MGQLILIEKWAENLEEVTLNRWLKQVGDYVNEGDSLCEIITDKVTFEYEVEMPGHVRRLYCAAKSVLPVGYAIAFIGGREEQLPRGVEEANRKLLQQHAARAELELELEKTDGPSPTPHRERPRLQRRVRATPAARRVARENDISIEQVAQWLEDDAVVTQADVDAYLEEMEDQEE